MRSLLYNKTPDVQVRGFLFREYVKTSGLFTGSDLGRIAYFCQRTLRDFTRMSQKVLLSAKEIDIILHRLACQLLENHLNFSDTVLIGLQPRGPLSLPHPSYLPYLPYLPSFTWPNRRQERCA